MTGDADYAEAIETLAEHPLPWRNQPSEGENHVTDARGEPVYDGADAAEMFRLYGCQVEAEAAKNGDLPGASIASMSPPSGGLLII